MPSLGRERYEEDFERPSVSDEVGSRRGFGPMRQAPME